MTLVDGVGFSHPILRDGGRQRRDLAFAGLITTAALVVSLAIAMIAVSIGIARAHAATRALRLTGAIHARLSRAPHTAGDVAVVGYDTESGFVAHVPQGSAHFRKRKLRLVSETKQGFGAT